MFSWAFLWFFGQDLGVYDKLQFAQVVRLRNQSKLVALGSDEWPITHVDRSHVGLALRGFADSYVAYLLLASAHTV